MTLRWPSALAALTRPLMPPNAASDVAVAAFTLPWPLDELLLLPRPAARTTLPPTPAIATPGFFLLTFTPPTCTTTWVRTRASPRGHPAQQYPHSHPPPHRSPTLS